MQTFANHAPYVQEGVPPVRNDTLERNRLGTSTAHPVRVEFQSVYTPDKCMGMSIMGTMCALSWWPLGCVASNHEHCKIGFIDLHASSWNTTSQRLILQVPMLSGLVGIQAVVSHWKCHLHLLGTVLRPPWWLHRLPFAVCFLLSKSLLASSAPMQHYLAQSSAEPIAATSSQSHTSLLPSPSSWTECLSFNLHIPTYQYKFRMTSM